VWFAAPGAAGRRNRRPAAALCQRHHYLEDAVEQRTGIVERAFEIARSGDVASITILRSVLVKEGYSNVAQVLAGRSLKLQLARMITEAAMAKAKRQ